MSKLRTRLVLMSLIGIVPALAAILYTQSSERDAARVRTLDNNLRITRLAAQQQASLLNGARRLLLTLAHAPALWADDLNACHALLSDVLNEHRDLSRLMLADAEGTLLCSSLDAPAASQSGGDRPWFRLVLETKTTAIGEYQISRLTGEPNINIAHPLLDRDGNVKRVLVAAVELATMGALVDRLEIPAGATLAVFDHNRTILARHPDAARWVGQQVPSSALRQATEVNPADMIEETGVDGVRRLYVGAPVGGDVPTGLYVGMGIERSAAFAQVNRMFYRSLWLLATIAIVAIITAMASGEFFVLRPVKELIAVTGRLARGDLASRAHLAGGPRELGELGDAFNSMAAALQTRQLERDHAEQRLRDSEERYRMPFEHAPNPCWVYDVGTLQFMEVNRAACDHYGYTRQEFLEMRISDIRPEEEVPVMLAGVERMVRERGAAGPAPWTHRKKDGTLITVEISSMLVTIAGRQAAIVLAHDVSERAHLEHQLRHAQKMEAIGQLAGGVAHDFNNLLTAIMGYSEIALEMLGDGHEVSSAVKEIEKAGVRAATLTRQLLAFSRKQLLSPAVLDPNAVIDDVERLLRRLIGEQIELRIERDIAAGAVKADPNQLEQVLLNLAVNARDAMPGGGVLSIETRAAEVDDEYARTHPDLPPGQYVVISVSDTGIGMDEATVSRIFEPFFTTKSAGDGTGLGLAVVYGIVRQSGGHVVVHSEPGTGSTFDIYLPRVDDVPTPTVARRLRTKASGGSETILVAEDEDLVRRLLKTTLTSGGYSVLEARDGVEALEVCEQMGAALDLLVTDVVMPRMTGLELARRLAIDHPDLKVLCLSGYSAEATSAQRPMEWPFLAKPFVPATLLERVREVLDGERYSGSNQGHENTKTRRPD
jgi:two-component system cell cycle sensor histidine kinase/response regulator CckA